MSVVTLRSRYGVSCDPYDPSRSPLALLLPHYSEVTHIDYPIPSVLIQNNIHHMDAASHCWRVGSNSLKHNIGTV